MGPRKPNNAENKMIIALVVSDTAARGTSPNGPKKKVLISHTNDPLNQPAINGTARLISERDSPRNVFQTPRGASFTGTVTKAAVSIFFLSNPRPVPGRVLGGGPWQAGLKVN